MTVNEREPEKGFALLIAMEKLLSAKTKLEWTHYSTDRTDREDYVGSFLTGHARVRFYEDRKNIYIIQLVVESEESVHAQEIEAAKHQVLSEILPAVGASEIQETKPIYSF